MADIDPSKQSTDEIDILDLGELDPVTGTAQHEALAQIAAWRAGSINGDDYIIEHFAFLTHSPAFRDFLLRAKATPDPNLDENWNISWFGAEMFAAGLLAGIRLSSRSIAKLLETHKVEDNLYLRFNRIEHLPGE